MRAAVTIATIAACASARSVPPSPREPGAVDLADPSTREITHRRAADLPTTIATIEGAVIDANRNQRVPGVVVTATRAGDQVARQTVTDEHGGFRFDHLAPGSYAVSAYYAISGRGQFEVRRSAIVVEGGEDVSVPLVIEVAGRDQLNQ